MTTLCEKATEIWEIKKEIAKLHKENLPAWEAYYKESYLLGLIDKLHIEIERDRLERDLWFEKYLRKKDNRDFISAIICALGVWVIIWMFICYYAL